MYTEQQEEIVPCGNDSTLGRIVPIHKNVYMYSAVLMSKGLFIIYMYIKHFVYRGNSSKFHDGNQKFSQWTNQITGENSVRLWDTNVT